jgi:hypothetical protein
VIRFKLKTLLGFAAIVALAAIAWTLIPKPFGITAEDDILVISTPGLASSKFNERPIPGGDGRIHFYKLAHGYEAFVPIWFVRLLLIVAIASVVGLIVLKRVSIRRHRTAKYSKP